MGRPGPAPGTGGRPRVLTDEQRARNATDSVLRMRYGVGLEEYEEQLAAQGGVCLLCGRPPKTKRLHLDHNHTTNEFRGILCWRCNMMVGVLEADADWFRRAAEYLKKFGTSP